MIFKRVQKFLIFFLSESNDRSEIDIKNPGFAWRIVLRPVCVRSFYQGWWYAVGSLSMCLQPPPALRPRPGPVRFSPLTLGLVLYILQLSTSLAGGFLWQGAKVWPSYRTLAPAICYPHRQLSPHPDAPNLGVIACHICKRTHASPLYVPENLIS